MSLSSSESVICEAFARSRRVSDASESETTEDKLNKARWRSVSEEEEGEEEEGGGGEEEMAEGSVKEIIQIYNFKFRPAQRKKRCAASFSHGPWG